MTQPRWLELAWGDLGVAETPGPQHTARVVAYYAAVGHQQIANDETAWCAAFLGACLERAGIASTRSLMARSYLAWGAPIEDFRLGAIAVLSRTADPALGHAGFLVGETADSVILLGGNQGDRVSVEAFPRSRLLALRWPLSVVIPEGAPAPIRDPGASDLFNRAITHVLAIEGGWSEDPYDRGGPTNFGITLATYARDKGVALTADTFAELKAELRAIPQVTVRRIYLERYWRPARCPQLTPALALFHFDCAVNRGVGGAARMLQEAVGAAVDGEIGPETLGKSSSQPVATTLAHYADIRRRHYRSLSTFWRFGKGWLARVDATLTAATALAAEPSPPLAPSQPKETTPMTDQDRAASAPLDSNGSKWWGSSITIWGAAITTLSTVLPAVAPLLGFNITAELIQQLGDQAVQVAQAVGGLAGTILTVYGRTRASTPLERRRLTISL